MVSRVRYVCEGCIITGLGALSLGAYLSYDLPITGSWIALLGSWGCRGCFAVVAHPRL